MSLFPAVELDRTAFFLDIDGTLLDIAQTPDTVRVPAQLIDDLDRLRQRCGGALALVSGRTLEDIDRLFAPLKLPAAGAHGTQVRPDPTAQIGHLVRPIPAALRAEFMALADRPGIFVEDKEVTLAMHYRLLEGESLSLARVAALEATATAAGFALLRGKKVLELKPAGSDKGTALRNFMAKAPFQGRTPIFAGDDTTDSYAFAVLDALGGTGISVGQAFPGAAYRIDCPAQMRQWLHDIAALPASEHREMLSPLSGQRP